MRQRRPPFLVVPSALLWLGLSAGVAHGEVAHAIDGTVSAATTAGLAAGATDEAALARAWKSARWPADIVERVEAHLQRFPSGSQAAGLVRIRDAARRTADLIARHDVRLHRTSFEASYPLAGDTPAGAEAAEDDIRRAALGDAEAAWRIALRCQAQPQRRLGWLQLAEVLGHGRAAYELALYYRRGEQPLQAAQHEAQAQLLGFGLPSVLDHLRK